VLKFQYKFKAFVIASISVLLVILIDYPLEVLSKKAFLRSQVEVDFNWFKSDLNKQLKQLDDFFIENDNLTPSCTPTTLLVLRKAHFNIQNIAELGIRDPKGNLICNSWQKFETPMKTSGIKPPKTKKLRFFGPITANFIGETALIIAKTRSDGYEINALLPQSLLNRRINELDRNYSYVATVDSIKGKVVTVVGEYTLPVNYPLFPLTKPIAVKGVIFDDAKKHFLIIEPLKYLPRLALMIAIDESVLYEGVYYPSLSHISFYAAIFILLVIFIEVYQQNYQSRKSELRNYLKQDRFVNYYQLIWDSNTKEFVGAETLVRLNHPIEGILTPNRFLPDIESNNLNISLTYAVIKNLITDSPELIRWDSNIKININITGEHLKDFYFKQLVFSLNEVIPHLVLELTENELIDLDDQEVIQTMQDFKAKNILIAIDDFGTGYAGLQYLKSLPLDILKIDRSYVSAIGTESQLATLLDALIELAKTIGIDVVAEGVETQVQADYLLSKGVFLHQGWLFHKASPVNDVVGSIIGRTL